MASSRKNRFSPGMDARLKVQTKLYIVHIVGGTQAVLTTAESGGEYLREASEKSQCLVPIRPRLGKDALLIQASFDCACRMH